MCLTRLIQLAIIALGALALSGSSAFAQDGIEVTTEPTGEHCSTACQIHIVGTSHLTVMVGGTPFPVTICDDEFIATLNEDGAGFIHEYENNIASSCNRQNCNGVGEPAGEGEWPFEITETGGETENAHYRFCLDTKSNPNTIGNHCTVDVPITRESSANEHHYLFTATNLPCLGGAVLFSGIWETETDFELVHLDD